MLKGQHEAVCRNQITIDMVYQSLNMCLVYQ